MSAVLPAKPLDVVIPPVAIDVEGAKVIILEVIRYTRFDGATRFLVSCQVECQGWLSPQFRLDVKDERDLINQLRVEVSKMQLLLMSGFTRIFQRAQ